MSPEDGLLRRARRDAYRLLARRARTVGEVRTSLSRRHDPDVVDSVLEALRAEGSLDDERTAREWLAWRREHDPLGRLRLKHELRRRGLEPDQVADALGRYYEEHREEEDLARALRRILGTDAAPTDTSTLRRLTARLERRGFPGGVAREALRGWRGTGGPE